MALLSNSRINYIINKSNLISRDLSWLKFNYRVLDQVVQNNRSLLEKLKFMAITSNNLDEFFVIRVGSLYNYLDYNKIRIDYSGLRIFAFRLKLLNEVHKFIHKQYEFYNNILVPSFKKYNFSICTIDKLNKLEKILVSNYFHKTVFPMLTPMTVDTYRSFPLISSCHLFLGITTEDTSTESKRINFILIPQNLPRFFEIEKENSILFIPIEEIIKNNISYLFKNTNILSVDVMRIIRNGDFTLEESEDMEIGFIDEIKGKLENRKKGRVVKLETSQNFSPYLITELKKKWNIDDKNVYVYPNLLDLSCLFDIVSHPEFRREEKKISNTSLPDRIEKSGEKNIFNLLEKRDILLHYPYDSMEYVLQLLEMSAIDPYVLAIKITLYRVNKNSRIVDALLKAARNGKHVSVLFELKARFDEENNIKQAERLEQAGCFVIHGVRYVKTHSKVLLIVRKYKQKVKRYVHLSTGNYNEKTAKLYSDINLITCNETYGDDVSEFFNAITGHSMPKEYTVLLSKPKDMRQELIKLILKEIEYAKKGMRSGIILKMNSLQDEKTIKALYQASQAGVMIYLIIRGICCLRPQRKGLSENIQVKSIVGNYLEHSRIFYFHNQENPTIFCGSADVMVRSFDRRIETLFLIKDEECKKEMIKILYYNLLDNVNSYEMNEDGTFNKINSKGRKYNIFSLFFNKELKIPRGKSLLALIHQINNSTQMKKDKE